MIWFINEDSDPLLPIISFLFYVYGLDISRVCLRSEVSEEREGTKSEARGVCTQIPQISKHVRFRS